MDIPAVGDRDISREWWKSQSTPMTVYYWPKGWRARDGQNNGDSPSGCLTDERSREMKIVFLCPSSHLRFSGQLESIDNWESGTTLFISRSLSSLSGRRETRRFGESIENERENLLSSFVFFCVSPLRFPCTQMACVVFLSCRICLFLDLLDAVWWLFETLVCDFFFRW